MILEYFEIVYLFSEWRTLVTNLVTSASRPEKNGGYLRINFNMFLQKSITFTSNVLWGVAQLNF